MRKLLHVIRLESVKLSNKVDLGFRWVSTWGRIGWDWKKSLTQNLRNAVEKIVKFTNNVSLSTRAITRIGLSGSWMGAGGAGM